MEEMRILGMRVFVSDRQPADKISIIGVDRGQPGGDWTAHVEMERIGDNKWRVVRYAAHPTNQEPRND